MATCISHSPADTEALGEGWGRTVQSGLVIGLCGDLGAGKTELVKGLARGLGITTRVHSPSFSLVNIYSGGRLTLFHLDLYRLDRREQITAAGLEEYLSLTGITAIEWAERWFEPVEGPKSFTHHASRITHHAFSKPLRWVQIETLGESERRITYEDFGA